MEKRQFILVTLLCLIISGCDIQSQGQNEKSILHRKPQWVSRYSARSVRWRGSHDPEAIITDDKGNVYVAGCSSTKKSSSSYAVVKYNHLGKKVWSATFPQEKTMLGEHPRAFGYTASDIAVDESQNVYVTGGFLYSSGGSGSKKGCATIKYDCNGKLVWARFHSGDSDYCGGNDIALDSVGNVYVAMDCCTMKYDNSGNEVWSRKNPHRYYANNIEIDTSGNLFVMGGSSFYDAVNGVIKYDSEGNKAMITNERILKMSLGKSGSLYLAPMDNFENYQGIRTVKYDSHGKLLWSKIYDNLAFGEIYLEQMAIDNSECIYLVGKNHGTINGNRYVIIKYDSDGEMLWSQDYNLDVRHTFKIEGVSVDPSGLVILLSEDFGFRNTSHVYYKSHVYLYKIDKDGKYIWSSKYVSVFGVPYPHSESQRFLTQDNSGNIFVTGCGGEWGGDFVTLKLKGTLLN